MGRVVDKDRKVADNGYREIQLPINYLHVKGKNTKAVNDIGIQTAVFEVTYTI